MPEDKLAILTEQQRAVVQPPYSTRLDRPLVTPESALSEEGPAVKRARSSAKKEFDQRLFGTSYF